MTTRVLRECDLSAWQNFQLWVESDAAQLGMELTTYYAWCCLVGLVQSLSFYRCLPYFSVY